MQVLALELDNYSLALQPAARQDDEVVWVPADAFAFAVAAECKEVDGQWAMCRGDLCILLAASEIQVLHEVRFARIDACAAPLDLRRSMEEGFCRFRKGGKTRVGWVSGRCRRCLSCPNSSVASWSPRRLFAAEPPSFICGPRGQGAGGNCQAGSLSMRSMVKRSRSW